MSASTSSAGPILFRGSPPGADAQIPGRYEQLRGTELWARLDMPDQKEPTAIRVVPRPAGDAATRLHLRLPMSMPVGTYRGTLRIGSDERRVELQVDGHSDLRFSPSHLTLTAKPGASEDVDLTVVNRGNLPVAPPETVPLELMDGGAIPRALHALHDGTRGEDKGVKGRDRLSRAADEIGRSMQTLRIEIQEGAGVINPGELRELRLHVSYPKALAPGQTYVAAWPMANQQIYIVAVHVPQRAAPQDGEVA